MNEETSLWQKHIIAQFKWRWNKSPRWTNRAIFRRKQEDGRKDPGAKRYKRRNVPTPSQIITDLKYTVYTDSHSWQLYGYGRLESGGSQKYDSTVWIIRAFQVLNNTQWPLSNQVCGKLAIKPIKYNAEITLSQKRSCKETAQFARDRVNGLTDGRNQQVPTGECFQKEKTEDIWIRLCAMPKVPIPTEN